MASHGDVKPSVAAPPPAVAQGKDDLDDEDAVPSAPATKSCFSETCKSIAACPASTGKCIGDCNNCIANAAFNCYGHCFPLCAGDEVMKRQGNLAPPTTWTKRRWANEHLNPCDDFSTSLFVCFCPLCAAGEIADAAGPPRDYHMTCFFFPVILPCLWPCWLSTDRLLLAKRYDINDDQIGFWGSCLLGYAGCLPLLLCQELNTVRAIKADAAARRKAREADEAVAQAKREERAAADQRAKEEAKAARIAAMALPPQQAMGAAAAPAAATAAAAAGAGIGPA